MPVRLSAQWPVAVAASLALSGCLLPPGGIGTKVPLQIKVNKVQAMTRTFSVARNPGLSKAAESVKVLAVALQSAFASTAGLAGAASSGPRQYGIEEALTTLRAAGMRATYQVSGVAEQGDAKLIFDDETHEVTAIEGKNAKITFAFVNNGNQRSWDAVIVKAPDGTTGKFHIEVTGGWKAMSSWGPVLGGPVPTPMESPLVKRSPKPTPMPSSTPIAGTRPAAFAVAQADEPEAAEEVTETGDAGVDAPAPTPPAYKWLNGEYPETVETARFTLEIVPKGDASLAFKMEGTFDEPANVPNTSLRMPTHWTYNAMIPKVSFDWESRLSLVAGRSKFSATGTMNVESDIGKEQFTYEAKGDEQARSASFAMTNVGAKVKLLLSGSQKSATSQPTLKSVLISTEDNTEIGTVALDPRRPRFAVVTFSDKTTTDWELYPANMFPQPAAYVPSASTRVSSNGSGMWDPLESTCRHASLSIL